MPSATIQIKHGTSNLSGVALPVVFLKAIEFGLNESVLPDDYTIRVQLLLGGNLRRALGCMNYAFGYIKLYVNNIDNVTQLLETTFHEFGHFDHYVRLPDESYDRSLWPKRRGEEYADDYMSKLLVKFFNGEHEIKSSDLRHFETLRALNAKMLEHSHKHALKVYSRYKW